MIIDAENLIIGRLGSFVAKNALLGEEIAIVNCEKAVVTGSKKNIIENYKRKISMGDTFKGPFYPKTPERIVKRVIRGMISYKSARGRAALKRVLCYNQMPEVINKEELISIEKAHVKKNKTFKFMVLKDICKEIGKYGK